MGMQRTVKEGNRAGNQDDDVIPGNVIGPHMLLADGVVQIPQNKNQTEKEIQFLLRHHGAEERDPDTVERKGRTEIANDLSGNTFPDADIRLPVILLHHLFHILGGADIRLRRMGIRFLILGHDLSSPPMD